LSRHHPNTGDFTLLNLNSSSLAHFGVGFKQTHSKDSFFKADSSTTPSNGTADISKELYGLARRGGGHYF